MSQQINKLLVKNKKLLGAKPRDGPKNIITDGEPLNLISIIRILCFYFLEKDNLVKKCNFFVQLNYYCNST